MTKKDTPTSFFSDEDWENLLPGKPIKLGSKTIIIRPFGVEDFKQVVKQLVGLRKTFTDQGITKDNFQNDKLPEVAEILFNEVPELIEKSTEIPSKDLMRLPLAKGVEIVALMIEVNLESQEGLEKNLQGLVGGLQKLSQGALAREATPITPTKTTPK